MLSMSSEKPICAPPRLSEKFPQKLILKLFICEKQINNYTKSKILFKNTMFISLICCVLLLFVLTKFRERQSAELGVRNII